MAPAIISINQTEAPKVSPMREPDVGEHNRELYAQYCQQEKGIENLRNKYKDAKQRMDRMKTEGSAQKKMILDMTNIVRALHAISIDYDTDTGSNGSNVTLTQITSKIHAIDKQLKTSMLHTVQLQELKKIASSTIVDQEEQIKSLENQVSLLEARMDHSDTHKDILLPDTSYEAQIMTMKQTIDHLQVKIKEHETEKRTNDISTLKEGLRVVQNKHADSGKVIDLTAFSDGQPVSVNKDNHSYATEEVTSHPSSYEEEFKATKERAEDLETENQKLIEAMEEAMIKMTEMSKSAVVLQNDMETMQCAVKETKKENEELKLAESEAEAKVAKMTGEIEEAEVVKADFEELERTVIAKVQELEKENAELKSSQEQAVAKIVELTTSVADAENIQNQLETEIKRLQQQNVDSASRIEELSIDVAESDQVKSDFEELERTVIARVDALETENRSLKRNQEEFSSNASVAEDTERARARIADLEEENTKLKGTLQEIEEENERLVQVQDQRQSLAKKHPWQNVSQSPNTDLEQLQEENARLKNEQEKASVKIAILSERVTESTEGDEELQKATAQVEYLEQENLKLKRSQSQALEAHDSSEDMHLSAAMVLDLEAENQRLRETMISAEEAQKLREDYRDLEQKLAEANVKLHSLQAEHTRALMLLDEKSESQSTQSGVSGKEMAKYKRGMESFEKLKRLHHAVVMKLADLGEDNGTLKDQLDETHAKLAIQQETVSILVTIKEDYAKLMDEYDRTVEKLNAKEQSGESMSMLRQEYADARAKIAVLQWENGELNRSRESYNSTEAKITILERQVAGANESINVEKKKSAERLKNMKDVIAAYKNLDTDYQLNLEKLRKLRALMDGETKKSESDSGKKKKKKKKGDAAKLELLENQRNAAWEQLKDIEKALRIEKQRSSKASEAKEARENDLKVVLQEYEGLQAQYQKAMKRVEVLKANIQALKTPKTKEVEEDIWEDEPIEIIVLDDQEEFLEEIIEEEEEEKKIESSAPKASSKSNKNDLKAIWQKFGIAKAASSDSVVAQEQTERSFDEETPFDEQADCSQEERQDLANIVVNVDSHDLMSTISNELLPIDLADTGELEALEKEHKEALAKLAKTESDLLVAQREAEDAKKTQVAREVHMRDSAAKLFKLEREHEELQGIVSTLKSQVAQAKNAAREAEAETKGMRKHLETTNAQYKELQEKHASFLKKFNDTDPSMMAELVKENEDMSQFCDEFLTTMTEIKEEGQKTATVE